ncbi:hypothetical protein L596_011907 [Steinernema carpocapsae]|uniref:Nuclear receptor domain-containing protein n=1 Tax=Steinernema carpocapsae TaxID=34508 RepID=A0A4U5NWA2_STECR|nr:hypothetical protein L596_011907 [Steinernema carpocapsae]
MPSGPSSSEDECRVCGSTPHGIHFGVYSCRACAAFFRRTVVTNKSYKCRRTTGDCNVKNSTRYPCRSCRFDKCKRLGMKFTSDEDPKSPQNITPKPSPFQQLDSVRSPGSASSPQVTATVPILKENESEVVFDLDPTLNIIGEILNGPLLPHDPPLDPQISYTILQRLQLALDNFYISKEWILCEVIDIQEMLKDMETIIIQSCKFIMSCAEFAKLPLADKWHLIRKGAMSIFNVVRMHQAIEAFGFDCEDSRIVCGVDRCINLENCAYDTSKMTPAAQQNFAKLTRPFFEKAYYGCLKPARKIRVAKVEIAYMAAVLIWRTEENSELSDSAKKISERVIEQLGDELHHHYKYVMRMGNYANRLMTIAKMIEDSEHLNNMRKEFVVMAKVFDIFSCSLFLPEYF